MATLKRGERGDAVRRLQALLCLSGIDAAPIDGAFGSGTERAVRACQERDGLPATGEADEDTQKAVGMDRPDTTKVVVPVIDKLTADIAAQMFARSTPRRNIEKYLPEVLSGLQEAGMDDRDMVLMALGTIRAETEGFEPIDERVSRFNTESTPFDRYDDRADLGNRGRPDGAQYKGRGFIQLTGRANYRKIGDRLGLGSRLEDEPELANDPGIAARVLAAFLADKHSAIKYAILGKDLKTARKLVNGGSHGLDRFRAAFKMGAELLS